MLFLLDHLAPSIEAIFTAMRALLFDIKSRLEDGEDVICVPTLYLQCLYEELITLLIELPDHGALNFETRIETMEWMQDIMVVMSSTWPSVRLQHERLAEQIALLRIVSSPSLSPDLSV